MLSGFALVALSPRVDAQPVEQEEELFDLSVEELLEVPVTLAGRRAQTALMTAAAVYVITPEEIEASGLTSLPELLRLAPGVSVGRIDANKWSISIRGLSERFSDKLLVMLDSRTLFTPLFSGTYWDVQDTYFDDIARIEVVRGPGGSLWGSNAINGIINVVTKSAADTQGLSAYAALGLDDTEAMAGARWGGEVADGHYRVYGKYDRHDAGRVLGPQDSLNDGLFEVGSEAQDDWQRGQVGTRADLPVGSAAQLTLQGDAYVGRFGQTRLLTLVPGDPPVAEEDEIDAYGANALARYTNDLGNDNELRVQGYYDFTSREDGALLERRHTADVDAQYTHSVGTRRRHAFTGGMSYRLSTDDTESKAAFLLDPAGRTTHLFGGFLQAELELADDLLWVTGGSKLEHNDYTGVELQPGARALLRPTDGVAVWSAVTRAVSVPSRAEIDAAIEVAPGMVIPIGNPDLNAELLWAYELGGRWVVRDASIDAALFYNHYRRLIVSSENGGRAETYGGELAVAWQLLPEWLVRVHYAHLTHDARVPDGAGGFVDDDGILGNSPRHRVGASSSLRLGEDWRVSTFAYYVADQQELDDLDRGEIPDYFRLDLRLRWNATDKLSLALVGQNLTDTVHFEATESLRLNTGVERSVYIRARATY